MTSLNWIQICVLASYTFLIGGAGISNRSSPIGAPSSHTDSGISVQSTHRGPPGCFQRLFSLPRSLCAKKAEWGFAFCNFHATSKLAQAALRKLAHVSHIVRMIPIRRDLFEHTPDFSTQWQRSHPGISSFRRDLNIQESLRVSQCLTTRFAFICAPFYNV